MTIRNFRCIFQKNIIKKNKLNCFERRVHIKTLDTHGLKDYLLISLSLSKLEYISQFETDAVDDI